MLRTFSKNPSLLILPKDVQHFDPKTNTRHIIRKAEIRVGHSTLGLLVH